MDSKLIDIFWTQTVHTTIHIQNRVMLRNNTNKTPYELWKGRPANVKHLRAFGRKCYIKREDGRMGKFDSCVDIGILVGYSSTRKKYKCYSLILNKVVESIVRWFICAKKTLNYPQLNCQPGVSKLRIVAKYMPKVKGW